MRNTKSVKIKNNINNIKYKNEMINHPIYIPCITLQVLSILKEFFQPVLRQNPFPQIPFTLGI